MSKKDEIFKKLIMKNFGWKVFSFAIAVLLWFVVMNIINPTEIKTISVNLTLLNMDRLEANDLIVINEEELKQKKVEIKVRGTRPALDELMKAENRKNIKATVDMQQFDVLYAKDISESINVSITPSLPSNLYIYNYEIVNYAPGTISVTLDNLVSTSKKVDLEITDNAKEGFNVLQPSINPEVIEIKGAASEIEQIADVKATVSIKNASSDINTDVVPVIYDKDGNVMSNFILNTETVNVKIGVNKQGELPISEPAVEGTPQEGYKLTGIEWEPRYFEIISSGDNNSSVQKIELPSININGATENKVVVFDIRPYLKNTGIVLKNQNENEVTVTVHIEEEKTIDLDIPTSQLNVKGIDSSYDVDLPDKFQLKLRGLDKDINGITSQNVKCSIDLSNLKEGTHQAEIQVELPENVVQADKTVINVVITADEGTSNTETTASPSTAPTEENTTETTTEEVTEAVEASVTSSENESTE